MISEAEGPGGIGNASASVDSTLDLLTEAMWKKAMYLSVFRQGGDDFMVESGSGKGYYRVRRLSGGVWECECQSFMHRGACSHIGAAAFVMERDRARAESH